MIFWPNPRTFEFTREKCFRIRKGKKGDEEENGNGNDKNKDKRGVSKTDGKNLINKMLRVTKTKEYDKTFIFLPKTWVH